PHDVDYLGMTAKQLCGLDRCRIVHFMFHDRVAFGGVLITIGILYLWLAEFPLRNGEAWAWWALAASGTVGVSSFLTYLGTGYLDAWHGAATVPLLLVFAGGLLRSRGLLTSTPVRSLLLPGSAPSWSSAAGLGRALLLCTAVGQIGAGATISVVGMTSVFVPQDLA